MAIQLPPSNAVVAKLTSENSPELFNADGSHFFQELQKLVGGYVQLVTLRKPYVNEGETYRYMAINEEGKLSGLEFNPIATAIAKLDNSIAIDDVIVGTAVLLKDSEIN